MPFEHDEGRKWPSTAVLIVFDGLVDVLNKKREKARRGLFCDNVTVLTSSFIDNTQGAIINSETASALARRHAETQCNQRSTQQLAMSRRQLTSARRVDKQRDAMARIVGTLLRRRVQNVSADLFQAKFRSMGERLGMENIRT